MSPRMTQNRSGLVGVLLVAFAILAPYARSQEPLTPLPIPAATSAARADDVDQLVVKRCVLELGSYRDINGLLLIDEKANPTIANVGQLLLVGDFETSSVIADDLARVPVPVEKVSEREWLIKGKGRVFVLAILTGKTSELRRYEITIDSLKPGPGPDPVVPGPDPVTPDPVPTDAFDNIGQRVFGWAQGIPGARKAAPMYARASELLAADQTQTIDSVSLYLVAELSKLVEFEDLLSVRKNINADLQQRWAINPLPRDVLADYYKAISIGLGASQ